MTIVDRPLHDQECIVVFDEHDREIGVAFDECQWLALMGGDPGDVNQFDVVRAAWRKIFDDDPRVAESARKTVAAYFGEML